MIGFRAFAVAASCGGRPADGGLAPAGAHADDARQRVEALLREDDARGEGRAAQPDLPRPSLRWDDIREGKAGALINFNNAQMWPGAGAGARNPPRDPAALRARRAARIPHAVPGSARRRRPRSTRASRLWPPSGRRRSPAHIGRAMDLCADGRPVPRRPLGHGSSRASARIRISDRVLTAARVEGFTRGRARNRGEALRRLRRAQSAVATTTRPISRRPSCATSTCRPSGRRSRPAP